MLRCLELAGRAAGYVSPNPMVGAVLVHNDTIISEGYHQLYGAPHAEVNCLGSVAPEKWNLIPSSVLYVSLEPCAHFGKTPPCADLIIRHGIQKVVIGCRDPFPEVDGKGIERLEAAGIEVVYGVEEKACRELNRRFFTFHTLHRPYIILKWAQTADGIIGTPGTGRLQISNPLTNRLVHQWRSEEAAIMVGTNTALHDDPLLTNRLWSGPDPIRVIVDTELTLPASLHVFDGRIQTIVFNALRHGQADNLMYYQITHDASLVHQVLNGLYALNVMSVMIEGGARLLQSFIDEGAWDEARVITNNQLSVASGLAAPRLTAAKKISERKMQADSIEIFVRQKGPAG